MVSCFVVLSRHQLGTQHHLAYKRSKRKRHLFLKGQTCHQTTRAPMTPARSVRATCFLIRSTTSPTRFNVYARLSVCILICHLFHSFSFALLLIEEVCSFKLSCAFCSHTKALDIFIKVNHTRHLYQFNRINQAIDWQIRQTICL